MTEKNNNKIAIVIPLLRRGGGAEKNAAWLSTELSRHSFAVSVVTFFLRENEHAIAGERLNFGDYNNSPMWVRSVWRAVQLSKTFRQKGIGTVISFTEEAAISCLLTKVFGYKGKIILAVRNNPEVRGVFSRLFIRLFYRSANIVVANSLAMADILKRKFGLTNVSVIYNPCFLSEMDRAESLPEKMKLELLSNFIFVSVGRLIDQKNQELLIRSFAQIAKKYPNTRLLILGEGVLRTKLEKMISILELKEKVLMPGVVSNVFPYLEASDVFVLPSLWEGFPNALLDALAVDLPCIATDCQTGPREILAPNLPLFDNVSYPYFGEYGVLMPIAHPINKAAVSELEHLMTLFVSDPTLSKKYSQGSARTKDFNLEKTAERWVSICGK